MTRFSWKECADLPTNSNLIGITAIVNERVYYGGIVSEENDTDQYTVFCYDPLQDKWTTLPPLPVRWFGLGQVNGELVAVGGMKGNVGSLLETNKIHTYDEQEKTWKQTIPPMPTARWFPGVLSLQSALIVAGGACIRVRQPGLVDFLKMPFSRINLSHTECFHVVEIFKQDTLQWYTASPLPIPCHNISLIDIGNTCYALGGFYTSHLNQVLHASVDDLLGNAVPANQPTRDTQSAWKTLSKTPTYATAAAVLAGNLLAVGVEHTSENAQRKIYMHVTSVDSWIYVGVLPVPSEYANIAVANLSPLEILVIEGSSVNKGTPIAFK